GVGEWKRFENDDETFLCGRRVACRSPMLLPGLFHMLQARLANKYQGGVRLRDGFIGISLDGWDSRSGGVVAAGNESYDDNHASGGGAGHDNSATIVAAVEFVESDLPGGDTIDLAVASDDRKAGFLTLLGLRLILEQVLSQAPLVSVEDMAIAAASLKDGRPQTERLALPLSAVTQNKADDVTYCDFGSNSPPESVSDLLWDGPEEFHLDEAGRIVTIYSPSTPSTPRSNSSTPTPTPTAATRKSSKTASTTASAGEANPFAPGFSHGGGGGGGRGGGSSPASGNPFAVTPPVGKAGKVLPATAAAAVVAGNPFAPVSLPPP
ncbi:unnamed protein product, partial [Laminaria digitata]